MATNSKELNLDRRGIHRLNEVVWLLAEACRLEHDVATCSLKVDIDADLDLSVELEVCYRFVGAKGAGVFHALFFPLLVIFEGEAAESTSLLQRLQSITQEHKALSNRERSTLRPDLRSDAELVQAHAFVVLMREDQLRLCVV